jgi:hypothetical protein
MQLPATNWYRARRHRLRDTDRVIRWVGGEERFLHKDGTPY